MTKKFTPSISMPESYIDASERHLEDAKILFAKGRYESAHEHSHFALENLVKSIVNFSLKSHKKQKGHDLLYLADIEFGPSAIKLSSELIKNKETVGNAFETIASAWGVHCRYTGNYLLPSDVEYIQYYWKVYSWIKMKYVK